MDIPWHNLRLQWNSAVEILLLAAAIYYLYLYFRGTRGARVLRRPDLLQSRVAAALREEA